MNGSTLRVRFLGGARTEQAVAKEQAGWWAQVANLKFEFNNALNAEIRGHHVVDAQFSSRCDCSEFQYRQFISGVATGSRGGVSQDLSTSFRNIPGGRLPITSREDGMTHCAGINYGHRDQPSQDSTTTRCGENRYMDDAGTTDQANGCMYRGEDFPKITVNGLNSGDDVDLLVEFRGEI